MPPAQPHDAIFRALLEIPGFADALIRWLLPTDIVALLPDEPFMLVESVFVDSELRTTPRRWRVLDTPHGREDLARDSGT